jgi:L,D-transpeptidase YcbB
MWRTEFATLLACAVLIAIPALANESVAEATSDLALQSSGANTPAAKPGTPGSQAAKADAVAETPVAAIDDRGPPTAPLFAPEETDDAEETQSATETKQTDTGNAEAQAEARETHPVLVELLKQLTERSAASRRVAEDDVVAIASFYAAESAEPVWTDDNGFTDRAQKVTEVIGKADDWGLKATDFDLPKIFGDSSGSVARATAELKLTVAALTYARHARGGRLRPRSVSSLFDQKPEIADPVGVLNALASTADAGEYLKRLHPQHPQFERLRQALINARGATVVAASKPGEAKTAAAKKRAGATTKKSASTIRRILANMERWRWMPRDLGPFYVWDDVPAQRTQVISDGKVLFNEKMVVGKPKTPTPMFSADMKYIIFHPSWGVPPGMKRNELLPQLRNSNGGWFSSKPSASAVLRSHGLRVTRGGVPVNPDSIDWSSVNISSYHFTQPPGPTNVLGIVKFRFPNRHNVYMHDTPERHLFGGNERAFSHGCMRIQNPIRLAEVLLKHDKGWNKGEVRQKKRRGARVKLSTPIPVHIAYFTVAVGESGKLNFRRDLYGLDRRVASKLEGRSVRMSSLTSKRAKRSSKRKKRRIRRAAKKKKKPFNPFASLLD